MSAAQAGQPDRGTGKATTAWQWWTSLRAKLGDNAKYLVLLVSLESLTWTGAFYGEGQAAPGVGFDWEDLNILITLLAGIFAISRTKRVLVTASTLGVLAFAAAWSSEAMGTTSLFVAGDVAMLAFFGFTAAMVIHDIWKAERVSSDTVIGSVCAYMLIGATWALLYSLTELVSPGSFHFTAAAAGAAEQVMRHRDYPVLMYFSFVTLASLGYGDIIPVHGGARMLATAEAIVGQFYVAILVARLVALHLAHSRSPELTQEGKQGQDADPK